jgi:hypothetical protein
VADAFIFDMPVKLGLEFVTIVGAGFLDTERNFLDDMINEVDCVCLRVFSVNFERPSPSRIVDSGL